MFFVSLQKTCSECFSKNAKSIPVGEPEITSVGKPENTFKFFYGEPKNNSVGKLENNVLYISHVLHVFQTNSMFFNP